MLTIESPGEAFSLDVGRLIGERLQSGDVLALWGELGAGKTLLTRGIARGLEVPEEIRITSPTFTLINEYEGRLHLYHLDLYRLADETDLDMLAWRDALFGGGVAVIEWPERMGEELPGERWDIRLSVTGDESRVITIAANGAGLMERLNRWAGLFGER